MAIINPSLLRTIALFQLLDDEEAAALAEQLEHQQYLAGQLIIAAGDEGGKMYVVQSGKVELFVKDKNNDYVCLGFVEAGELFGELSLLDNQKRSASAKAVENTSVFVVDRNDLLMLVKAHPAAALDMMGMLGKRIREADLLVQDRVVARNVNEEMPAGESFGERLSDFLTRVAGDIRFVYFNFLWFATWIILNTNIIPGLEAFDPFPFGLLTMIVSLEAIFLSLFVLISQNRQTAREKIRNDIEYEVNIKAELEIRELQNRLDDLQELMLRHLSKMNQHLEASHRNNDVSALTAD
jgi:CRP/FNR family transcriptional regulator, cyclic AMP receptor protein